MDLELPHNNQAPRAQPLLWVTRLSILFSSAALFYGANSLARREPADFTELVYIFLVTAINPFLQLVLFMALWREELPDDTLSWLQEQVEHLIVEVGRAARD